jgi:hypothetical protein
MRGRVLATALVAAALAGLTACAAEEPAPRATPTPPAAHTPAPTTAAPVALVPGGSAGDNLPYFTAIVERVWGSDRRVEGRAYVDALAAAGFDKAAMQVTSDLTTVGNPAESLQFAVRWNDECLVGQVGPDIGEAVTRVLPALQDDALCLLGDTRPIDW